MSLIQKAHSYQVCRHANGTDIHLTKLPPGWAFRVVPDQELLKVNTPAYGRFVGRNAEERPAKILPELVASAGETLDGKIAINGNNIYWHSQDFVVINGQLITRRNVVINSQDNLCLVQKADGSMDIGPVPVVNNKADAVDIKQAVFGLRLVEDGAMSFQRYLDQFRFDFRKILKMPSPVIWAPANVPAEVPEELSQDNFDPELANRAFAGERVRLTFDRIGDPALLAEGLRRAGYHDFVQEGRKVEVKLEENAGPVNAAGIDQDSNLWLMIANGRLVDQPGLTLRQVARTLIDEGVERAVCIEGGGDVTFFYDGQLKNIPANQGGKLRGIPSAILFQPLFQPLQLRPC